MVSFKDTPLFAEVAMACNTNKETNTNNVSCFIFYQLAFASLLPIIWIFF